MADDHPLKAFREREKLSPADLARFLGVARPTIHRWETGERKIGKTQLAHVAEKTGIPACELRPDLAELMSGAS
jgi:transcriptional regulator with XRE-family HTH domain